MIVFILKMGRDEYAFQAKEKIFFIITIVLGLYCLFVFIVLFVRLLNFITSPNMKDKLKGLTMDQDLNNHFNFYVEDDQWKVDLLSSELENVEFGVTFNWNKFKKCASRGVQTRVQNDHIGNLVTDRSLYFHVNRVDAFLGLIEDRAVYTSDFLIPNSLKFGCRKRISGTDVSEFSKLTNSD